MKSTWQTYQARLASMMAPQSIPAPNWALGRRMALASCGPTPASDVRDESVAPFVRLPGIHRPEVRSAHGPHSMRSTAALRAHDHATGRKIRCARHPTHGRARRAGVARVRDAVPPLAAHVVASRTWYTHHGIYVGEGKVVHYRGLSRGWRAGPVEEVSLTEFARGRPVRVRPHSGARFERDVVVARARSRLGEDRYRILSNNCEHLCEWCVHGRNCSRQVDEFFARPRRALLAALRFLAGRLASSAR